MPTGFFKTVIEYVSSLFFKSSLVSSRNLKPMPPPPRPSARFHDLSIFCTHRPSHGILQRLHEDATKKGLLKNAHVSRDNFFNVVKEIWTCEIVSSTQYRSLHTNRSLESMSTFTENENKKKKRSADRRLSIQKRRKSRVGRQRKDYIGLVLTFPSIESSGWGQGEREVVAKGYKIVHVWVDDHRLLFSISVDLSKIQESEAWFLREHGLRQGAQLPRAERPIDYNVQLSTVTGHLGNNGVSVTTKGTFVVEK